MVDDQKIFDSKLDAMIRLAVIASDEQEMAELLAAEKNGEVHVFSRQHETRMRKLFAKMRRKELFSKARKYAYRAAAIVLISAVTLFSALLFNDDVRASVRRVIIEWFEEFTRFTFSENVVDDSEADRSTVQSERWMPTYLPGGFEVFDDISLGDFNLTTIVNSDGDEIALRRMPTTAVTEADNEQREYRTVVSDGIEYHMFIHEDTAYGTTIIWEQDGFAFVISSTVNAETLLQIAISVTGE